MSDDVQGDARRRLASLAGTPQAEGAPARSLRRDAELLGRLLAAADQQDDGREPDVSADDVAAALGLLEDMRTALDRLEAQVVIEARRRGMDWRQIASHRGLNSSQAASQRYQRLVTRLEEIRQGVR